jgi:UDP-3-O-[3-hydroxymyristoyl] glucosamine N-acyltransferase LpxD
MDNIKDSIFKKFDKTCSIYNPQDWGITFAKNIDFLVPLCDKDINLVVFIQGKSAENYGKICKLKENNKIYLYKCENVLYDFYTTHNIINLHKLPKENVVLTSHSNISPYAVLGAEGVNIVKNPVTLENIQIKHMGNVYVSEGVIIGAGAIIERAVLDTTFLGKNVYVDVNCVVGHNSFIGDNTIIAANSVVAGSCFIGKNCQIGIGSMLKNGTVICDNVVIGAGSVVTKDIIKPGIYYGSPAKFHKPYDKNFKF